MIYVMISLALVIITILLVGYDRKKGGFRFQKKCLFALLWLLLLIPSCFEVVQTGEVGIKIRFGKITDTYLQEGINLKFPFERIETVNIKVQKYENDALLETSTKDMQIVNSIKVAVNYQIDADKAIELYRQVGNGYTTTVLEPAIQESIKSAISKYTAEELITKRSEVATDIQEELIKRVEQYGIKVLSISIKNFDFSAEYNASIERKAVAEQDALTAKQKLETTKVEAEKKRIEAQAEADANRIKENSLTDKILKQQFIEKWNGELPKVSGSDNLMIDINSILK